MTRAHLVMALTLFVAIPLPTVSSGSVLKHPATKVLEKCPAAAARSIGGSDTNVVYKIRNAAQFSIDLYWVNHEGKETQPDEILAGGATERQSFEGHVFRARQQGSGILLFEYQLGSDSAQATIVSTCIEASKYTPSRQQFQAASAELIETLVHDQAAPCHPEGQSSKWSCVRKVLPDQVGARPEGQWGFHEADELKKNADCRSRKIGDTTDTGYSNKRNRQSVNRVTKGPGYLKMSLDPGLWAQLQVWSAKHSHYWDANATTGTPTNSRMFDNKESIAGCYANTHQFPFAKLDLDAFQSVRRQIVAHMKDVLEWWTNQPLEHTSTYGMRIYKRQAMLVNHVDRSDTHVASAVIQVHQTTDPDGGWPLEVVGEDDVVREVYLQPGEMVLYEGARLLHGRPMRFKGEHFGNIFTHFKPNQYYDADDL